MSTPPDPHHLGALAFRIFLTACAMTALLAGTALAARSCTAATSAPTASIGTGD